MHTLLCLPVFFPLVDVPDSRCRLLPREAGRPHAPLLSRVVRGSSAGVKSAEVLVSAVPDTYHIKDRFRSRLFAQHAGHTCSSKVRDVRSIHGTNKLEVLFIQLCV